MKYLTIILFFSIVSCKKEAEKNDINVSEISSLRTVVEHPATGEVSIDFQMEIAEWNELNGLKTFFVRFKKASPKEVLSNSLELRDFIKLFKESQNQYYFKIHLLKQESIFCIMNLCVWLI